MGYGGCSSALAARQYLAVRVRHYEDLDQARWHVQTQVSAAGDPDFADPMIDLDSSVDPSGWHVRPDGHGEDGLLVPLDDLGVMTQRASARSEGRAATLYTWLARRYFIAHNGRRWVFHAKTPEGKRVYLFQMNEVKIIRHVKVRNDLNPFDPEWQEYLRRHRCRNARISMLTRRSERLAWLRQDGLCPNCRSALPEPTEVGMDEAGPCLTMDSQLVHRHCMRRWNQSE